MECSKVNPENFITIQGFMVTELGLKGNELILYALIYGFTQDGESEFCGSIGYMCEWTNCSRPTVSGTLSNLVKKGLIIKRSEQINGVTFNRYKVSIGGVKNLYGGSKESLQGVVKNLYEGSKESLPNNNIYNNNIYDSNIYNMVENKNLETPKANNKGLCSREEFEKLWKLYPRKQGKETAFNAYKKAVAKGATNEEIAEGIHRYVDYIKANRIEARYIKHGATWFSQNCWNDEYNLSENRLEYTATDSDYDISNW